MAKIDTDEQKPKKKPKPKYQKRVEERKRKSAAPGKVFGVTSVKRIEYSNPLPARGGDAALCNVLSEKRKGGPRKNCPVQLSFQNGKPVLRLCTAAGKPGRLIALPDDGAAANKVARRICSAWSRNRNQFPDTTVLIPQPNADIDERGFGGRRLKKRGR